MAYMPDMQEEALPRPARVAIHRCREVVVNWEKPYTYPISIDAEEAKWAIPFDAPQFTDRGGTRAR